MNQEINNDNPGGKKVFVRDMFNNIAKYYDFLNHFLSLGIDRYWRNRAIRLLKPCHPAHILDVATGTGDFAIQALSLKPEKITAIDISEGMLEIGRKKALKNGLDHLIHFQQADSENLPFAENTFDAAMVAFGVRNFENLTLGLKEINRVLRPGSPLVILEFSKPRKIPVRKLYFFYFRRILPLLGRYISGDAEAYTYLPDSVMKFPEGNQFKELMHGCGFVSVTDLRLTGGIVTVYKGDKPDHQ